MKRSHAFRVRGADCKLYHKGNASIVKASHVYPVEDHPIGTPGGPTLEEFRESRDELRGQPMDAFREAHPGLSELSDDEIRALNRFPELDPAAYIGVVHAEVRLPD